MKARSIRVTLLSWYALILLSSMGVLSAVLLNEMRALLYQQADAQLAGWVEVLRERIDRARVADGVAGRDFDRASLQQIARSTLPIAARFAVFDAQGAVLAASEGYEPGAAPLATEVVHVIIIAGGASRCRSLAVGCESVAVFAARTTAYAGFSRCCW